MTKPTNVLFWRDKALPFVELRQVFDGRLVSYAAHSHEQWSIGAILNGYSEFICEGRCHQVEKGTLVMMNPHAVHACNPQKNSAWAYYMLHIDFVWLANTLHKYGIWPQPHWQNTATDYLNVPELFADFIKLAQKLMASHYSAQQKTAALVDHICLLFNYFNHCGPALSLVPGASKLQAVADYLEQHCLEDQSIDAISAIFGYHPNYLVRVFKQQFNLTPHAYRLNRRVQLGQHALKAGIPIAEVAQNVGFSDQAHFQRAFKQRVAATPNQYRRSISKQNKETTGGE